MKGASLRGTPVADIWRGRRRRGFQEQVAKSIVQGSGHELSYERGGCSNERVAVISKIMCVS